MFDLIWTVLSYGVEIWEWKEREEVERVGEIFKMVIGSGGENAGVYGRNCKGRN